MRLMALGILLTAQTVAFAGDQPVGHSDYEPFERGAGHKLVELAAEQEVLIERRGYRYDDPALQEMIDRVAATVLPDVADDYINYRIYLVRDPSPISFSLADGQIYIHTGFLARMHDERQLAAVIAHEAHHVAAHHHFTADQNRRANATALGVVGVVAGIGDFATMMGQSFQTKFSDEMEVEADKHALELVARAGYPQSSVAEMLDIIARDPELRLAEITGSWTTTGELELRRTNLQTLADGDDTATLLPQPLALRELVEITIDDYIRLDRAGAAVEWIDALIADNPDAFLYAAKGDAHAAIGPRPNYVTEGLTKSEIRKLNMLTRAEIDAKYLATADGQERQRFNTEQAINAYTMAIQLDEGNARAYAGLGKVYFESGKYRLAGRNLLTYLKLRPDAPDRHLAMEKLQFIRTELRNQKEGPQ